MFGLLGRNKNLQSTRKEIGSKNHLWFINWLYPKKSKEYRFHCPNHSTRIVETSNARFIENGEVSGSVEPRKVEIEEVKVDIPLPKTSSQVVVSMVVEPQDNLQKQYINDHIHNNGLIINENVVEEPQQVALRRSSREKRSTIYNDYVVYLQVSEI